MGTACKASTGDGYVQFPTAEQESRSPFGLMELKAGGSTGDARLVIISGGVYAIAADEVMVC